MRRPWPEPVQRVGRFLREARAEASIQEFSSGTPTAQDAATAIGCKLEQIVKSLVFVCEGRLVLVMVPGSRRADPKKVAAAVGASSARIASPHTLRQSTGFDVGGVAPFPLPEVGVALLDQALLGWKIVWIGAGSDRHMAGIAPTELVRLSRARTADVCVDG